MNGTDLLKVAARASEIFCDRARAAGRDAIIPTAEVYGPGDVANILQAADEVAGNGKARDAIYARLQEMMDDVRAKQAVCRGLLGAGDVSDAAFADKDEAQAALDGACEIARLALGEEVEYA